MDSFLNGDNDDNESMFMFIIHVVDYFVKHYIFLRTDFIWLKFASQYTTPFGLKYKKKKIESWS